MNYILYMQTPALVITYLPDFTFDPSKLKASLIISKQILEGDKTVKDIKKKKAEERNAALLATSEIAKIQNPETGEMTTIMNPGAGYVSGTDPVGEFYVANEVLSTPLKTIGKGIKQLFSIAPKGQAKLYGLNNSYTQHKFIATTSPSLNESLVSVSLRDPEFVNGVRGKVAEIYTSPLYKERLIQAGFTEKEASSRIKALLLNLDEAVLNEGGLDTGVAGQTGTSPYNLSHTQITIDPRSIANIDALKEVLFEEYAHASELTGITRQAIEDQMIKVAGSVEGFKQKFPMRYKALMHQLDSPRFKALNADKAANWNSTLGGEVNVDNVLKQKLSESDPETIAEFYRQFTTLSPEKREQLIKLQTKYFEVPSEKRARGLGWLNEMQERFGQFVDANTAQEPLTILGREVMSLYKGNENYLNKFIVGSGIIGTANNTKKHLCGGIVSYLNYINNEK